MFSVVKNPPAMQGMQEMQTGSLGQEDLPGEGNGNPLQYSCLGNPMDRRAWWATVRGVAKSQTWLSTEQGSQLPSTQLFSCFSAWGSCCPESVPLLGALPASLGCSSRSAYQHTDSCLILNEAAGDLKQRHLSLISFHSTEPWEHRASSLGIPFLALKPTDAVYMNGDTSDPRHVICWTPHCQVLCWRWQAAEAIPGPGRSCMPRNNESRAPQLLSFCPRPRRPQS